MVQLPFSFEKSGNVWRWFDYPLTLPAVRPAMKSFLREEVEDDDGDNGHHRPGHQHVEGVAIGGDGGTHADGNGEFFIDAQHDQQPEQVVPAVHADQDRHSAESGDHDGHHDAFRYQNGMLTEAQLL